jgi:hypothetical protein
MRNGFTMERKGIWEIEENGKRNMEKADRRKEGGEKLKVCGGGGGDRRGRSKREQVLLKLTCNGGVLGHLVGQGVDESLLQVGEEHLVSPVHQFCGQPALSIQGFQNINFQCKSFPPKAL